MRIMYKMLLMAAVTSMPLAAANAASSAAEHRAWIAAQKIDIQPTISVRETTVPADQVGNRAAPPAPANPGVQRAQPATNSVQQRTVPGVQPAQPATRSMQPAQPASPAMGSMPAPATPSANPSGSSWSGHAMDPARAPAGRGGRR